MCAEFEESLSKYGIHDLGCLSASLSQKVRDLLGCLLGARHVILGYRVLTFKFFLRLLL